MGTLESGKVLLVAGLYGAGKTTLIGEALRRLSALSYVPTFTTRPARANEKRDGTHEYIFVNESEYDRLRKAPGWDHTRLRGVSYGADAAKVNRLAAQGQSFIVATTMYAEQIRAMRRMYSGETALVFLDTDFATCQDRIMLASSGRSQAYLTDPAQSPAQADLIREIADFVYEPVGVLAEDKRAFADFIRTILA